MIGEEEISTRVRSEIIARRLCITENDVRLLVHEFNLPHSRSGSIFFVNLGVIRTARNYSRKIGRPRLEVIH